MRKTQRLTAIGALVGLTALLGAYGTTPTNTGTGGLNTSPSTTSLTAPPSTTSPSGVTQISDIYGPACNQVPASGPGSAQGMVRDAVGTAASNNPLLTTLARAVQAANLVDTLNNTNTSYTIFAPANSAFQTLPPGTVDKLLADPQGQLKKVLTYHVVPQRYDAEGLARAGTVQTVEGEPLTITGQKGSLVIDKQTQAHVLCGNIPTANATVFVIDKVLMPPSQS